MKTLLPAAAAAMLLAGPTAQAQLFKCKGPDGKVVYSDQRCASSSTDAGAKIVNAPKEPPAVMPSLLPDAPRGKRDAMELPEQASGAGGGRSGPVRPERLTYGQEERIRNLEVTASTASRPEQRSAARMEIDAIRSGREAMLSSSDRSRRDSLVTDLDSIDHRKRQAAQSELSRLYNNH